MILYTKNGKEILVDEDFVLPSGVCLTVTSHGYASLVEATGVRTPGGWYKYKRTYLHRYITGATGGMQVDHINGDRLDNRSENLRVCLNEENSRNKGPNKKNKSGYKGVYFNKSTGKWIAQLTVNYKCRHLGTFETAEEAALAYNKAAKQFHGEFAFQNEVA